MKTALLFGEAVLMAGPITALVAYFSIPTLIMYVGIPLETAIGQSSGSNTAELPLFAALAAFPLGVFALVQLWALAVRTARGKPYHFGRIFWLAFACGTVGVLALGSVTGLLPVFLISLPAYVLVAHFAYVQRCRRDAT